MLCCFALFVCLTFLLTSFFLPSHLSFKNMYNKCHCTCMSTRDSVVCTTCIYTCTCVYIHVCYFHFLFSALQNENTSLKLELSELRGQSQRNETVQTRSNTGRPISGLRKIRIFKVHTVHRAVTAVVYQCLPPASFIAGLPGNPISLSN